MIHVVGLDAAIGVRSRAFFGPFPAGQVIRGLHLTFFVDASAAPPAASIKVAAAMFADKPVDSDAAFAANGMPLFAGTAFAVGTYSTPGVIEIPANVAVYLPVGRVIERWLWLVVDVQTSLTFFGSVGVEVTQPTVM